MIQTLDFFTPVVDDPYLFGQIAAANSLSDVYAMGGEPKVALNIVCFPNCLDPEILGEILRGGADKVLEAGAVLVGGHSVQDDEPKYGLSVTGFVHPDKIYKNYGCQPGDVLVLTKQLGSGIVNTTVKAQMASEAAADEAVKVMASLNQRAKRAIEKHTIHACTDVTGFGLLGHCTEMAEASDITLELYPEQIEYMTEAIAYARMGLVPAGAYKNREFAAEGLDAESRLQIFRDFFKGDVPQAFPFDLKQFAKKGTSFKDWMCPDSMEFERDHFRIGDRYGRVLYMQDYASYVKDDMISELCDFSRNLMLSIDILPVPTDEAVREIQNRLLGVETNVTNWQ